ncbi:hypothetical protein D3C76_735950 [compost metagenome]
MLLQALLALLEQNVRLLQGFLAVLQTLTQLADGAVVQGQQLFQAAVVQFGMTLAPLLDLAAYLGVFLFQGTQTLALGLEFGCQFNQACLGVLQLLGCLRLLLASLLHRLLQVLLPLLGTGLAGEQAGEAGVALLLLAFKLGELRLQLQLLLCPRLLLELSLVQGLLAFAVLELLIFLPLQQVQALGQLLVQTQESCGRLTAQFIEGVGGQQRGEARQLLLQTLLIGAQGLLLLLQMLAGLLAGFARGLQLLLQAGGILLQGQQGVLALFVAADVIVQAAGLQLQPGRALADFLVGQCRVEQVCLQARRQALQLLGQLLLLVQVFLDLTVDAAQLRAQFVELLLQFIDCLLGVVFFILVMPPETLQQGFGLMVGMLLAATHRAGLVILKLCAQLFDTLAAGQTLTFEQLAGDIERLFGGGQLVLAVEAFADQLFSLLEGDLLALAQGIEALFQLLLLAPQPVEFFHLALLLAIFLQQLAK